MDLQSLSDFALVARSGGFAQASRSSSRPKASLSRKVMALEQCLGVRLFERASHAIRLTQEGEFLFARTAGPLAEIREAAETLRDGQVGAHGRLRLSVPVVFGQVLLGRLAAEFTIRHPGVQLEVTVEDRAVDMVAEGYDLVIRINPEPTSTLVGRCFVRDRFLIVAAPSVAMPNGNPSQTLSIVSRAGMRYEGNWRVPGPDGPYVATRKVLELPTLPSVREAVLTGIGAAKLPRVLVADDLASGRLVSWGNVSEQIAELWALHVSRRLPSSKIRAFLDFLDEAFPEDWL